MPNQTDTSLIIGSLAAVGALVGLWWHSKHGEDGAEASSGSGGSSSGGSSPPDDSSGGSTPPGAFGAYTLPRYAPLAPETIALFTSAAKFAGLPTDWAASVELHNILAHESDGWVGRPNYQFGDLASTSRASDWWQVWTAIKDGSWRNILDQSKVGPAGPSSATGLGQLTSTNIKTGNYYPSGLNGIGNALEEAVGMLRYIAQRYGTPQNAWAQYGVGHEGY